MANVWVIFCFAVYFAMLIAIAVVGARRIRNMADYTLGGRRLSSFTAALSTGSSTTSAWTMLALPALAFVGGLVELWVPVCAAIGVWLSWTLLAKRLRRFTIAADNAVTIPEFMERRFGDATGVLRSVSGLVTILFVIFYVSSGLVGGSKLLEEIFGLNLTAGVILTLLAVATYTLIGGFMAVSRTDVSQALLMLVSLGALVVTMLFVTGNPLSNAGTEGIGFFNPFTLADGSFITLGFALSALGWVIGGLGAHRILQRFMAIEREDRIAQGRNMAVIWLVTVYLLAFAVGVIARPALSEAGMLGAVADPERVYFVVSEIFFHPVVLGALLTAVIAAVMSTADSQLLLASAIATEDMPVLKRVSMGTGDECPGVDGPGDAGGHRHRRGDAVDPVPGLHIRPGELCVGRNGGCVRAGDGTWTLLAQIQRLGRRGSSGDRGPGGDVVAVPERRPGRHLGHPACNSRLCHLDGLFHRGHAADTSPGAAGTGPVRQGECEVARREPPIRAGCGDP